MSFFEFLRQATATGSRSTVLKPLMGLIAILAGLWAVAVRLGVAEWIGIVILAAIGITVAIFLFTFVYCLFKNPDLLRSEKYSLQRLAIEKGMYGDSQTGLLPEDAQKRLKAGITDETKK